MSAVARIDLQLKLLGAASPPPSQPHPAAVSPDVVLRAIDERLAALQGEDEEPEPLSREELDALLAA